MFNFLIRHIGQAVRSIPEPCLLCAAPTRTDGLCEDCRQDLPGLPHPHCPVCANPTHSAQVCDRCLVHPPAFDAVAATFTYAFPIDRLVTRLKFGGTLAVSRTLGLALARTVAPLPPPDLVTAMPLSVGRQRTRGFNQAAEIARTLVQELHLPHDFGMCQRLRDTPPQMELPLNQRHTNMRGAFDCSVDLHGARVAVVDDVMTSGASMDALARALKTAGASHVAGWLVARTPEHR